jgi:phospholipase C
MLSRHACLAWLLATLVAGCESGSASNEVDASGGDDVSAAGSSGGGMGDGAAGPDSQHGATSDAASDGGPHPGDDAGANVDAGRDAGHPQPIPIHHVVVIVKENHTYDNMYGSFVPAPYVDGKGVSHPQTANGLTTCPVPPSAPGVPTTTGPCLEAADTLPHDLSHAHAAALADWDNGKLDGWSTASGSDNTGGGTGDGTAYMQYFERDIPNYWGLARSYVLADNFYAGMLGPSFPGHLFTVAAQAGWATGNPPVDLTGNVCNLLAGESESPYWGCDEFQGGSCDLGITTQSGDTVDYLVGGQIPASTFPCFDIPAIPDILPSGISWKFYGTDWSELTTQALNNALGSVLSSVGSVVLQQEPWSMLDAVQHIRQNPKIWPDPFQNTDNMAIVGRPWDATNQVATDIANGTLANVTWIVDQDEYSEHPNLDINGYISGLNFPLGGVCDGENWTVGYVKMLMQSPYWRDTAILITYDDFGGWYDHVPPPRHYGGTTDAPYGLGFRLPLLIVSPWVKHGFVLHDPSEQASIAKFVETVFGSAHSLSDLDKAAQDGQAGDLMNAFDFTQAPPDTPTALQYRCCPGESANPPGCVDNP